jgi:hypothetical protein
MASISNKERVGRVLDLVTEGLAPWMVERLEREHGPAWQETVRADAGAPPRDVKSNLDDPQYLFWVFDKQWIGLFKELPSYEDRRCVSALWDARKEWAHGGRFTDEQTERVLSDGEHLIRSVGAVEQAQKLEELRRELRRLRFEKDQKEQLKAAQLGLTVNLGVPPLPWTGFD